MTGEEVHSKDPGQSKWDHSFGPEYRIRKQRDFDRIFARRCSVSDDQLTIYGCENELDLPRLAVSVSRKLGKPVFRNRWRRLIREVFRQRKADIPAGIDYVVIPKKGVTPDFHQLWERIPALMKQLARRLRRFAAGRSSTPPGRRRQSGSTPPSAGRGAGGARSRSAQLLQPPGQTAAGSPRPGDQAETPTQRTPETTSEPDRDAHSVGGQTENLTAVSDPPWEGVSAGNFLHAGLRRAVQWGLLFGRAVDVVLACCLILLVWFYRCTISPLLGPCCRFQPSCSLYFIQAVQKYGAIRGACKGLWRILRCHPWNPGGYDPP